MADDHRAASLDGKCSKVRIGRIRCRRVVAAEEAVQVGNQLLVELVDVIGRELLVRIGPADGRAEPECGIGTLMPDRVDERDVLRSLAVQAKSDLVQDGGIEARTRARNLVRQIGGVTLADEILVPPHAPVRRFLERFRTEAAAVDHDDGRFGSTGFRDRRLILNVHLVDRDGAGTWRSRSQRIGCLRFATDEEAALRLQHQRLAFVRVRILRDRRSGVADGQSKHRRCSRPAAACRPWSQHHFIPIFFLWPAPVFYRLSSRSFTFRRPELATVLVSPARGLLCRRGRPDRQIAIHPHGIEMSVRQLQRC